MNKYYYVYKLEHIETNEFYFGSRTCNCLPELDIKYLGSMKTWKPDKTKLIKTIIKKDFLNITDALVFEAKIIKKDIKNILNRNYNIPGIGFCAQGRVTVKDKNGKTYGVDINDPRYLSGEFVSIIKGKINVKDKDGNIFQVNKNDERYLSGELIAESKGRIPWNKNIKMGDMSIEQKQKISEKTKLALAKPEIKLKIKLAHEALMTQKTKDKIALKEKGEILWNNGGVSGQEKRILCLTNNTIYDSIKECAKLLNLNEPNIVNVLKNKANHTKGYSFIYYKINKKIEI